MLLFFFFVVVVFVFFFFVVVVVVFLFCFFFVLFFITNTWRFKQATHMILGTLVELFPFDKITLKSHIFVLLLPSWASSVGVKQC